MKASVSLWSADLLALGTAVDGVADMADGLHLDVMDGVCVPSLLFGPDFVAALHRRLHGPARHAGMLRRRPRVILDVHLMMADTDAWVERLAQAGSDLITVHRRFCRDVRHTLEQIRTCGARAGLVVELSDSLAPADLPFDLIDRLLVMGTEIGVKGCDLDPRTPDRVRQLREACRQQSRHPEIFVDGGIRWETVPALAAGGADGVVPGSLVFGAGVEPRAAIRWIHSLQSGGSGSEQEVAAA